MKKKIIIHIEDLTISQEVFLQELLQSFCVEQIEVLEDTTSKPAGFIKDGLHGKFVMLKEQVLFGGSVVGVFRVDMFECCQPRHLLSLRLHT